METNIIFGPPGTGKTTHLLDVLEKELLETDPDKIAFVSFTREGAYQGRDRAIEKFRYTQDDFPYFRTLHSIAFRALGMRPGQMINKSHWEALSKGLNMKIKGYYDHNLAENDDQYLFYIDMYRNNKARADQIVDQINTQQLVWVEKNYRAMKEYFHVKDFTDLIMEFVARDEALPVKVAIIDEAQDLTSLQWQMIAVAFKDCERIYIAGDDDQAIYEWSGADVHHFIHLEGNTQVLNRSYRLPENILEFAKKISSRIRERVTKDFEPTGGEGHVIPVNELRDIPMDPSESYLFLSRNNMFLRAYRTFLMQQAIVFQYQNKPVIDREHITAINAYVRIQNNQEIPKRDFTVMQRHMLANAALPRPRGPDWYDALKIPNDQLAYYKDLLRKKIDITKCQVNVNTIHSVKGAEADNVILSLNVTRAVFQNIQHNPDSEHRVFYVGATRAKKNLYILLPDKEHYYDVI